MGSLQEIITNITLHVFRRKKFLNKVFPISFLFALFSGLLKLTQTSIRENIVSEFELNRSGLRVNLKRWNQFGFSIKKFRRTGKISIIQRSLSRYQVEHNFAIKSLAFLSFPGEQTCLLTIQNVKQNQNLSIPSSSSH